MVRHNAAQLARILPAIKIAQAAAAEYEARTGVKAFNVGDIVYIAETIKTSPTRNLAGYRQIVGSYLNDYMEIFVAGGTPSGNDRPRS